MLTLFSNQNATTKTVFATTFKVLADSWPIYPSTHHSANYLLRQDALDQPGRSLQNCLKSEEAQRGRMKPPVVKRGISEAFESTQSKLKKKKKKKRKLGMMMINFHDRRKAARAFEQMGPTRPLR